MARIKRGSILCPNCRKLISADEPHCPHCGTSRPGSWWKNTPLTSGFKSADQIIRTIIYVNIGLYVISLLLNPKTAGFSLNPLHTLAPGNRSLLLLGATGTIPIDGYHRWWTLISANYLHGGILHILFNMLAFRQLAQLVAQEYGVYRLMILYTLSGVVGFWVSYLAGIALTIGASAAVCGLIGATLFYGISRGGTYGQAIIRQIGGWALGLFLFGFLVPGINNWGHGGGIIAGAGLGLLMGYQEKKKENFFHKILAAVCMVLSLAVLGWAVISAIYYQISG